MPGKPMAMSPDEFMALPVYGPAARRPGDVYFMFQGREMIVGHTNLVASDTTQRIHSMNEGGVLRTRVKPWSGIAYRFRDGLNRGLGLRSAKLAEDWVGQVGYSDRKLPGTRHWARAAQNLIGSSEVWPRGCWQVEQVPPARPHERHQHDLFGDGGTGLPTLLCG